MKRILCLTIILVFLMAGCTQGSGTPDGTAGQNSAVRVEEISNMKFIQMIDEKAGWAYTPQTVFRTADGGESWVDVTPKELDGVQSGQSELAVNTFFGLDDQTAVLTRSQGLSHELIVSRTTDGGLNWKQSIIDVGDNGVGGSSISFVDHKQGWLFVRYDAAMGSEADAVFQTTDGGLTWKSLTDSIPREGINVNDPGHLPFTGIKTGFAFSDQLTGWLSGFNYGDGIFFYRSTDGGKTWYIQDLTVPEGFTAEGGSASSYPPVFFQNQRGVLPVEFRGNTPPALVFYLTEDGGKNWRAASPVSSSREPYLSFHTAIVDASHAYVTDGYVLSCSSDGLRTFTPVSTDLDLADVSQLDFISVNTGWAILNGSLWKTVDGGHTWKQ